MHITIYIIYMQQGCCYKCDVTSILGLCGVCMHGATVTAQHQPCDMHTCVVTPFLLAIRLLFGPITLK